MQTKGKVGFDLDNADKNTCVILANTDPHHATGIGSCEEFCIVASGGFDAVQSRYRGFPVNGPGPEFESKGDGLRVS